MVFQNRASSSQNFHLIEYHPNGTVNHFLYTSTVDTRTTAITIEIKGFVTDTADKIVVRGWRVKEMNNPDPWK